MYFPNEYVSVPTCTTDATARGGLRQCLCVGPQNGAPVCPCKMRDQQRALIDRLLAESVKKNLSSDEIEAQRQSWVRSMGLKPRIRVKAKGARR